MTGSTTYPLILFTLLSLPFSFAQYSNGPWIAVGPSSTSLASPTSTSLLPAFQTSPPGSLPTGNGNPSDDYRSSTGIVNYYFLLLAIFIFVIIILYILWTRKRRMRMAQYNYNREDALHRDVNTHGGGGGGGGHWYANRIGFIRQPRREEGLDERGEAPPPYLPDRPPPAVLPLQDISPDHHKPPGYTVHSSSMDRL